MSFTRGLVALVVLGAVGFGAPSAGADDRQGRDRRGGDRQRPAEARSAPRGESPRGAVPRGGPGRYDGGRRDVYQGRVAVPRQGDPYRGYSHPAPTRYTRGYDYNRGYGPRPYYPRAHAPRAYYPRSYYPRVYYPRAYYARPYYVFRPRVSIGFGLWVGHPVTYGYAAYGYPAYGYQAYDYPAYGYPYSYATAPTPVYPPYDAQRGYSGYQTSAPQTSVAVAPPEPRQDVGGVSFEITPMDAAVYVDGEYAGVVSNFTPRTQPLSLAPGPHRIEVRAAGYDTAVFELDVVAGEVTPYQGQLQPVR